MSGKQKKLKIEDNARNQVRAYLEVSQKSAISLCEEIRQKTDARITPPTIYNWLNRKATIKLSSLELIIDQMRLDGYDFNI